MSWTLEDALFEFSAAMLAKFYQRAEKWGDRSVTIPGVLDSTNIDFLRNYLDREMQELHDALPGPEEMGEAVDVANLALLIWWRNQVQP